MLRLINKSSFRLNCINLGVLHFVFVWRAFFIQVREVPLRRYNVFYSNIEFIDSYFDRFHGAIFYLIEKEK